MLLFHILRRYGWGCLFLLFGCGEAVSEEVDSLVPDFTELHPTADPTTLLLEVVKTDLIIPWDLVYNPSDSLLWYTEKAGKVSWYNPANKSTHTVLEIDDVYQSQWENSGLHSMVFHPQWPDSAYFYVHYTYDSLASKLVRYTYDHLAQSAAEPKAIVPYLPAARSHNGSRMQVGPDGKLYWCVGEAYRFAPAQDTFSLLGKVNRLNWDGSIPNDNPFPGSHAYSLGHRNPQGLVWASNGILYQSEHGTNANDEINAIVAGGNYGWPSVSGNIDLPEEQTFAKHTMVKEPLVQFSPTKAPSGLAYYNHPAIPEWQNCLLQAFLKNNAIGVLPLNTTGDSIGEGQEFFAVDYYRLRDVEVLPDGSIYFCTSNREVQGPPSYPNDDKIIHLKAVEEEGLPTISIEEDGTATIAANGYTDSLTVRYTRFYNVAEYDTTIAANALPLPIVWKPTEAQPYFIKIDLADGRTLVRRVVWKLSES